MAEHARQNSETRGGSLDDTFIGQGNRIETISALQRLLSVAVQRSAQSRIVARFLLGLLDAERFHFKLMDLRVLDKSLFKDCMAVLGLTAESLRSLRAEHQGGEPLWKYLATTATRETNLTKPGMQKIAVQAL